MKLYELPEGSKLVLDGMDITFHHVDGMYSFCTLADGRVTHLVAWSEWRKVDDHYELEEEAEE